MSYHIYTTKAVVLSERPRREADRLYTLLTRDLGLIRATAGGVRKEVSKLRGNLEPFSITSVSLVRGKGDWRITSAALVENISGKLKSHPKLFQTIAKIFNLIERLVAGEEIHPEIYDYLENISDFINENPDDVEVLVVSQILFELGYLAKENLPQSLKEVKEDRKRFVDFINAGLKESGLIRN